MKTKTIELPEEYCYDTDVAESKWCPFLLMRSNNAYCELYKKVMNSWNMEVTPTIIERLEICLDTQVIIKEKSDEIHD